MTLPVLYIIMRNDLTSMNAGKGMAQSSHAGNAFTKDFERRCQMYNASGSYTENEQNTVGAFRMWENSTPQGFGTVLTLEGKMTNIYSTINIMKSLGYIADIVHDPTYPIVDGEIVHHIPLDTCAYVFVPDKDTDVVSRTILSQYSLHR